MVSRRDLLIRAALGVPGLVLPCGFQSLWASEAGEELVDFTDYTRAFQVEAQAANPRVKCLDLRNVTSWMTPDEQFFAFHQTETVHADGERWRLRIGGCVKTFAEFSLQELKNHVDRREIGVTLECSGNSNHPPVMNGLVSNAVWSGVPLKSILEECGVKPEAREVVFFGMDKTREMKWQAADVYYTVPFGRSVSIQDAIHPDALLAFEMNGQPLSAERGFPLRLILPGWYGMAQVKWLARIEVLDRRYEGQHMARNYHSLHALQTPEGTIWLDTSISKIKLKSLVVRVTRRRSGETYSYKIAGLAWGGSTPIQRVEVQVDRGDWRSATIDERRGNFAWRLWFYAWHDATPGPHTLVSRAIDASGKIQPTRAELKQTLASSREDNSQWPRSIVV